MILAPRIEGMVTIRSSAAQFERALRDRVAAGLLTGKPHPRSNYRVEGAAPDRLRVCAGDWWTAIGVGLNEWELRLSQSGSARYTVRYWRWAWYAIALCGTMGLVGIALLLLLDVRGYIASHSEAMLPGLSTDQNLIVAWVMVVFWGFVWPWVLIALHKQPLRELVARLIAELDRQGTPTV
jgi:hypothetical protein